jgi:N-dimethylarginine dimethylaminohydrolase
MTFEADLTIIFRSGAILYRTVQGEADGEEGFVSDLISTLRAHETPVFAGIAGGGGFMASDVVGIDVRNVRDPAAVKRPRFPRKRPAPKLKAKAKK